MIGLVGTLIYYAIAAFIALFLLSAIVSIPLWILAALVGAFDSTDRHPKYAPQPRKPQPLPRVQYDYDPDRWKGDPAFEAMDGLDKWEFLLDDLYWQGKVLPADWKPRRALAPRPAAAPALNSHYIPRSHPK